MTEQFDPQAVAAQEQFLDVMTREAAHEKFQAHLSLEPLPVEHVPLAEALGRTLAEDVSSAVDVPGFDRANVDGFALRTADITEASPEIPVRLRLNDEVATPGRKPSETVEPGTATVIATGGMLPRGADAVLLVEDSDTDGDGVLVQRSLTPGRFMTFAGADIAKGETVLFQGQELGSREIGVLAAIGLDPVPVVRRPRVAILSTGDELLAPGEAYRSGHIYDSNGHILAAAVRELGGEPFHLGICPDDADRLQEQLRAAVQAHDMVLLSGGTSKGAGDISYRVVNAAGAPGVLVHGVALKPGKPICLAVCDQRPVVILPGFPTSAIFTFHEFVAPVIRRWAGRPPERRETVEARLPVRAPSEIGRTEYLLVGLVDTDEGLAAYPTGKGSGAVTAFSQADGFVTIDALTGLLEAESRVEVQCIGERRQAADLIAVGSHCVGLDLLLGRLSRAGLTLKSMHVGSTGGLAVARRGECDIAGIHLMDPETGEYNRPLLSEGLCLIPGYGRMQGIVYRRDDERFANLELEALLQMVCSESDVIMVNRNTGSGTRLLLDRLLGDVRPPGHSIQTKSHNAVAAAVASGRADWGMAIDVVARQYDLGFLPVQEEHYDFAVPERRLERPGVQRLLALLRDRDTRQALADLGMRLDVDAHVEPIPFDGSGR